MTTRGLRPAGVPSFSLVVESENIATTDTALLTRALAGLARQTLSPALADNVILIDSGDIPDETLPRLQRDYPWLSVMRVGRDVGYYEAKMAGVRRATSEVVVFYDSDVTYEPEWLLNIVLPFGRDPQVQVVAGETSLEVTGPYSLALLLTWSFGPLSGRHDLYPGQRYAANNVAFRRELLLRHPIPLRLPLYRGNCGLHAAELRRQGQTIWKQPRARAVHPLPGSGMRDFVWRALLQGHDQFLYCRVNRQMAGRSSSVAALMRDVTAYLSIVGLGSLRTLGRLPAALRADWRRAVFLPLTVPIIAAWLLLGLLGATVSSVFPHRLLARGAAS